MCAGAATTAVYPSTSAADVAFILSDSGVADRLRRGRRPGRQAARPARPPARPDPGRDLHREGRRRVGDQPGGPAGPGRQAARRAPDRRGRGGGRRPAGPPGHADLHVGHHGAAQGRGAAPPLLDLHRRGGRGARHRSARTTCSTCGCRWRTRSGRCSRRCSCRSGSPRPSTAAWTRSWRTSPAVRPTFMAGPPRIFEKVHAAVVQAVEAEGGLKLRLFRWAFSVGGRVVAGPRRGQRGRAGPPGPARAGRPAGAVEDPGPARWPDPLPGLRERGAVHGRSRRGSARRACRSSRGTP